MFHHKKVRQLLRTSLQSRLEYLLREGSKKGGNTDHTNFQEVGTENARRPLDDLEIDLRGY